MCKIYAISLSFIVIIYHCQYLLALPSASIIIFIIYHYHYHWAIIIIVIIIYHIHHHGHSSDNGYCYIEGELDANRPVPFRLTPNVAEFITPVGVSGVITSSMVSAARCLVEPQFGIQSILRAVLRDEMIAWHKKVHSCRSSLYRHTPKRTDWHEVCNVTWRITVQRQ